MQPKNTTPPSTPTPLRPAQNNKRSLLLAGGILAILALATLLVGFISSRIGSGKLHITTTKGGTISVTEPSGKTKDYNSNDVTLHVKAGDYQVYAKKDTQASTGSVTVSKGKDSSIDLKTEPLVDTRLLARSSARSAYGENGQVYFVETNTRTINQFQDGATAGVPYVTSANNLFTINWINSKNFFYQTIAGTLYNYNNGKTTQITYKGVNDVISSSVSVNKSGAVAFVAGDKSVIYFKSVGATPERLTDAGFSNARTALANNGDVLVYVPKTGDHDEEIVSKLYSNGKINDLPTALTGMQFATWSDDAKRFSYSNDSGIYVYDVATKSSKQVFTADRSAPQSIVWVDNTSVLFVQADAIWRYDTKSGYSYKLATFAGTLNNDSPFILGADGKTVYFATASSNRSGGVYSLVPLFNSLSDTEKQAIKNANTSIPAPLVIQYAGLEQLADNGIETDQIAVVKFGITTFAQTAKLSYNAVTISNVSVAPRDRDSDDPNEKATFDVTIGTTRYNGVLVYSGVSTARFTLSDDKGAQVYDSGVKNPLN